MKKPQVEKHKQQCRRSRILTCIDCCKDFTDNEYQAHTKCVTEDKKYGGANYKTKENKGEIKQQLWYEQVQRAIESVSSSKDAYLQKLLERLRDYPNIPRKEAKFKNFILNSFRERNQRIVAEAWTAISKAEKLPAPNAKLDSLSLETSENGQVSKDNNKRVNEEDELVENGNAKKKLKKDENSESPSLNSDRVKLKSLMKKVLKESDLRSMKLRKFKKRIAASMNIEDDIEKEKIYAKIDSKLATKGDLFILEGKIVRLNCI